MLHEIVTILNNWKETERYQCESRNCLCLRSPLKNGQYYIKVFVNIKDLDDCVEIDREKGFTTTSQNANTLFNINPADDLPRLKRCLADFDKSVKDEYEKKKEHSNADTWNLCFIDM